MTRARRVSAASFGGAAMIAVAAVQVIATWGQDWPQDLLFVALLEPGMLIALGASAALVGALAGRRVGAASSGEETVLLGIGVTVASAFVWALGAGIVFLAIDIAHGVPMSRAAHDLLVPELWGYVFLGGLVLSPAGALGAYVAWRWIRRGEAAAEALT